MWTDFWQDGRARNSTHDFGGLQLRAQLHQHADAVRVAVQSGKRAAGRKATGARALLLLLTLAPLNWRGCGAASYLRAFHARSCASVRSTLHGADGGAARDVAAARVKRSRFCVRSQAPACPPRLRGRRRRAPARRNISRRSRRRVWRRAAGCALRVGCGATPWCRAGAGRLGAPRARRGACGGGRERRRPKQGTPCLFLTPPPESRRHLALT